MPCSASSFQVPFNKGLLFLLLLPVGFCGASEVQIPFNKGQLFFPLLLLLSVGLYGASEVQIPFNKAQLFSLFLSPTPVSWALWYLLSSDPL